MWGSAEFSQYLTLGMIKLNKGGKLSHRAARIKPRVASTGRRQWRSQCGGSCAGDTMKGRQGVGGWRRWW